MIEEWRSYEAKGITYEVSNLGRVRRYIKPFKCIGSKYLQIFVPGKGNRLVHTLVAELFIAPKPESCEVNHKDGNGLNNRLDNLEYVTHEENCRHAVRTGLHKYGRGEKATRWKITDKQREDIIARRLAGDSYRLIAEEMGIAVHNVCYTVVNAIADGLIPNRLKRPIRRRSKRRKS